MIFRGPNPQPQVSLLWLPGRLAVSGASVIEAAILALAVSLVCITVSSAAPDAVERDVGEHKATLGHALRMFGQGCPGRLSRIRDWVDRRIWDLDLWGKKGLA